MKKTISIVLVLVLGMIVSVANAATTNQAPIADAGLPRYAGTDAVILDGTGSYDPDNSGPLLYAWQQIAGPSVVITDPNTATPTISGFVQTDEIQECEFELVVWDGELTSMPDTVIVIIVPDFGANTFRQQNLPFDADKPTIIYFGGGDCVNGLAVDGSSPFTPTWLSRVNIIYFPDGYTPDSGGNVRTYYKYGDMIIVYLSAVAPDYKQPIQTSGWSTGGQPAVDVGIHLNLSYADARYAVNRVTFFDATTYCRANYSDSIATFLGSSVDGEQCWADTYVSTTGGYGTAYPPFHENVLNVWFPSATGSWYSRHCLAHSWYRASLVGSDMNNFNHGVVAGAYWSVVGPGKNLQLASTPGTQTYKFQWYGDSSSGYMDFYDEPNHPGRLPEPVTLWAWRDGLDSKGIILTCKESENAVGYQLLFGSEPYRIMDYTIISDTPVPPDEVIMTLPFEETWWTVKAYDQFGSTIYADPICIDAFQFSLPIKNLTRGRRYYYIQFAIDDAMDNDEIVLNEGIYKENIDFNGKDMKVRSTDPNDPDVVAATVIKGVDHRPVVTLTRGQGAGSVLAGLTISGETVGISCGETSLTIRNCTIESTGTNSIEFMQGYEPIIIDCNILGPIRDSLAMPHWKLDEEAGNTAQDSLGVHDGTLHGEPLWLPAGGMIDGALQFDGIDDYISTDFILDPSVGAFSVFAWIQGGGPGQVIISQRTGVGNIWLGLDAQSGCLMTGLEPPSTGWVSTKKPLVSEFIITDEQWHHVGFVWDDSYRVLYVDGIEIAKDTAAQNPLKAADGGLYIGVDKTLGTGTFFSGLIDDVRIYDVALSAEKIAAMAQ
jgi:hypothetical protein